MSELFDHRASSPPTAFSEACSGGSATASNHIAHLISEYLGHTLNWVYTQIKHVHSYRHYVVTRRTMNLDAYPLDPIFVSRHEQDASGRMSLKERIVRRLGLMPGVDFRCFSSAIQRIPPIVLQAHFGWDGFFALALKRKHRVPLITRFYGLDVGTLPRIPMWRRRYHRLFTEGDLFIVEGNNMKSIMENLGCPSGKIAVHHLGVEIEKIPYKPRRPDPRELRILIAGTFKEKKGIEYAIRALAGIRERLPGVNLRAMVIGDGVLRDQLHTLAAQLGLEKQIEWTGYRPHDFFVQQLYEADLFLAPSVTAANGDTEGGAPVAIIEAGAAGLPVVSTTHADIPEVVLDGQTGFLAPERSVDSLVQAVVQLAANPDLRIEFAHRARRHVEDSYDAIKQGTKLGQIYSRFDPDARD